MDSVITSLTYVFMGIALLVIFSLTIYSVLESLFSFIRQRYALSRGTGFESAYEKALL